MPELNKSDGNVLTAADIDDIDEQMIVTCTSSTRPTGVEGRHIFETDTNKRYTYDGTSWNLDGGSGWVTFTPSWSGLTVSNGTSTGRYRYVDGGMWGVAQFSMGSTSSMTGPVTLTLPNSAEIDTTVLTPRALGIVEYNDSGTVYRGFIGYSSTTVLDITVIGTSGTYATSVALSSTVPFTWATSDFLTVSFFVPVT